MSRAWECGENIKDGNSACKRLKDLEGKNACVSWLNARGCAWTKAKVFARSKTPDAFQNESQPSMKHTRGRAKHAHWQKLGLGSLGIGVEQYSTV